MGGKAMVRLCLGGEEQLLRRLQLASELPVNWRQERFPFLSCGLAVISSLYTPPSLTTKVVSFKVYSFTDHTWQKQ